MTERTDVFRLTPSWPLFAPGPRSIVRWTFTSCSASSRLSWASRMRTCRLKPSSSVSPVRLYLVEPLNLFHTFLNGPGRCFEAGSRRLCIDRSSTKRQTRRMTPTIVPTTIYSLCKQIEDLMILDPTRRMGELGPDAPLLWHSCCRPRRHCYHLSRSYRWHCFRDLKRSGSGYPGRWCLVGRDLAAGPGWTRRAGRQTRSRGQPVCRSEMDEACWMSGWFGQQIF